MSQRSSFAAVLLLVAAASCFAGNCIAENSVRFRRLVLSEEFFSEGADFADINVDGHNDIVSGPFWYEGPGFRRRHRYAHGERFSIKAYSNHFFSFAYDLSHDQRPDILVVGMPGQAAHWYENPGVTDTLWKKHFVLDDVGNESPTFADLTGDGQPELICIHAGTLGYIVPNGQRPREPWDFFAVSTKNRFGAFTHGLGIGDVDGDGRQDVLETDGWHRHPAGDDGGLFIRQEAKFSQSGGAQMFAYDFDGDGDNDVVSVQNAHAWGLTWFERRGQGEDVLWIPHAILPDAPSDAPPAVAISQMHAVALADMDGDGVKDIITGKRYFAHGGGDPGAHQLPVLYWLRTIRTADGRVEFEPHLIDERVGVGTQLTVGDVNKDGRNDIVVGNKLGTFVLLNEGPVESAKLTSSNLAGTPDFALGVRTSEPLSPLEELQTFVLPAGFQAQLVAAEPDIAKPMNLAFDQRGRIWVTCTLEYPYPVEVGTPGRDSIKILEDTTGDGRADKITTFAEGLNIPIGLYPYQDGVICYSIPHIWFLRDTDGDGKCDQREKLYGPFDHTRDTHGMCNAFTRGYDGWLYACHGFNNHSKVSGTDGHEVTMQSGNTFRIKLDGSRIEHFTHGQVNPFGMSYDARGDLLTADCHTKPVTLLLRGGFYESFGKPHDGLGFVPPVMDHLHGSTAIGGIAVSDSSLLPAVYQNNTFGGNVMTSRVNRNSLIYEGSSVRAQEEPDFLISGDSWFRPVDLQIGPDGALYVADFYNRIIGHYEVRLDHPGRDRHRGRIWRIIYQPDPDRRDDSRVDRVSNATDLSKHSLDELIDVLGSTSHTLRMLAADRLVDEWGTGAVAAARRAFEKASQPHVRWHTLWILFRLDALTASDIERAISDEDALVRSHAQRVVGELSFHWPQLDDWIRRGLHDQNGSVNRSAALAAARHVSEKLLPSLLELYSRTPASDVHLQHVIRIALRNNLRDPAVFSRTAQLASSTDLKLLAGICLALPTPEAANFVVQHIEDLAADKARLSGHLRYAARYVSAESVPQVVGFVRERFADDAMFQLELLQSVHEGLQRRGADTPPSVTQWAYALTNEYLSLGEVDSPLSWAEMPHPDVLDPRPAWELSKRRRSADGMESTLLWSSFPQGEQRTGIYRSAPFVLGASFSFYLAGHDGFPGQDIQHKNLVGVRDWQTREVLRTWSPPRNDVAQFRAWNPESLTGRQVCVELVDGDTANAYAWLAVGRFSESRLNPSDLMEKRRLGAIIAGEFRLDKLRADLLKMMSDEQTDRETRAQLARAVAKMQEDTVIRAVAELLGIENLSGPLQELAIRSLAQGTSSQELLSQAMQFASSAEQLRVAETLASDAVAFETLLWLCESGRTSPRLLQAPTVRSRLSAITTTQQQSKIVKLTESLPDENSQLSDRINAAVSSFLAQGGDVQRGQALFTTNCAICHQVAGQGKPIGPNLDGIGNRGLERVTEDVFAPNRNVDVAFRATTIVTKHGQAMTGLVKGEDDTNTTLIDTGGKEILIPKSSIEIRQTSILSPMPANFAETLNEQQVRDMLGYLLQIR